MAPRCTRWARPLHCVHAVASNDRSGSRQSRGHSLTGKVIWQEEDILDVLLILGSNFGHMPLVDSCFDLTLRNSSGTTSVEIWHFVQTGSHWIRAEVLMMCGRAITMLWSCGSITPVAFFKFDRKSRSHSLLNYTATIICAFSVSPKFLLPSIAWCGYVEIGCAWLVHGSLSNHDCVAASKSTSTKATHHVRQYETMHQSTSDRELVVWLDLARVCW